MKKHFLLVLSLFLFAGIAYSQSPTNRVSYDLFRTDKDAFLDVNRYSEVQFAKALFSAGYGSGNLGLDYALFAGKYFIGTRFEGNIVTLDNVATNEGMDEQNRLTADNELNVLFGFNDQNKNALLFTFAENIEVDETLVSLNNAETKETNVNLIYFGLTWGNSSVLSGAAFRPWVTLGDAISFIKFNEKEEGNVRDTTSDFNNLILFGAGAEWDLWASENAVTTLILDNIFQASVPGKYKTWGKDGGTEVNLEWVTKPKNISEQFHFAVRDIRPIVGSLTLASQAGLEFSYGVSNTGSDVEVLKDNSSVSLQPYGCIALQFSPVVDKLMGTLGLNCFVLQWTRNDSGGNVTEELESVNITFSGGLNFKLTPNLEMDTAIVVDGGLESSNSISNWNFAFTYKY